MRTISVRRHSFSASHKHLSCGMHRHGHDWFIEYRYLRDPAEIGTKLEVIQITGEMDFRDVDDMIIGTQSTPEDLSAWFLERLRPHLPGLISVTVGFEGHSATTEV